MLTTLLERHGQGGSGEPDRDEPYFSSFLIADPDAGFVLETSNRTWAARPVGAGASISNRITLSTDWTRARPRTSPGHRLRHLSVAAHADHDRRSPPLAHTRGASRRGTATTARDLGALRDHGRGRNAEELPLDVGADGAGFSVCMHRRESHSQTTASMIVELRRRHRLRAWVSLGNPCSSVYVPCFPPAVAPELARGRAMAAVRPAPRPSRGVAGAARGRPSRADCRRGGTLDASRGRVRLRRAVATRCVRVCRVLARRRGAASTRRLNTRYGRLSVVPTQPRMA